MTANSSNTPKKTLLKGPAIRKEGIAAGAITPGHLVTRNSDGKFVVHGDAGNNASPMFAAEQDFTGSKISEAYAEHDQVQVNVCPSGCEVYAFLAAGANVNPTHFLESNGAGALRAFTNAANQFGAIVARPLESVNNSAGGAAVRIKVEIV